MKLPFGLKNGPKKAQVFIQLGQTQTRSGPISKSWRQIDLSLDQATVVNKNSTQIIIFSRFCYNSISNLNNLHVLISAQNSNFAKINIIFYQFWLVFFFFFQKTDLHFALWDRTKMGFLVTTLIFVVVGVIASLCARICCNRGPSTNLYGQICLICLCLL